MRIIAFGDIHDDTSLVKRIEDISSASYVIVTGDLTNVGGTSKAKRVIDVIKEANPRVLALAGNFDQKEVGAYLAQNGISLHGNGYMAGDVGIFGVGGSNKTPFDTPNELDEMEIEAFILSGYKKVLDAPFKLFISHAPPFDTGVDIVTSGAHVGSKVVREFIQRHQPDVCITGHIHEAKGEDRIGKTIIINPGMLKNGGYAEILSNEGGLTASLKNIFT